MKLGSTWRFAGFASAIVLVAFGVVLSGYAAWSKSRQFKDTLRGAQVSTFEVADHFQAIVLQLNTHLGHYQSSHSPDDWQLFMQEGETLDGWIDVQLKVIKDPAELAILNQINDAYDLYRSDAHRLTNLTSTATPAGLTAEQEEAQSLGLLAMGNKLANAHRKKMDVLVDSSRSSLSFLVQLVFGMLVVLIVLGAWVALIVYRDMIAPLRVQLIETHALMERQEKLASLGVLAAGVAHEIRNPLTAIKARLFTQQKRLSPGTPEAEDAVVINDEINRLERIVREFLQFARPAAPKRVTVAAEVPLQQVCDLMRPQLEKRGIALSIATVARANIAVDLQQIKQVLINLVQNAADSIGQNGHILLRARVEPGPTRSGPGRVILEVEDNGKGIPLEVQKRLFDPFFTTKDSGTGLGLAIAARIIEKHEGVLEFQTQMNHGTTFGVVLPRSASDEQHR